MTSGLAGGVEPYKEASDEEYMGVPMRAHFTKLLDAWKGEVRQSLSQAGDEDDLEDRDRKRRRISEIGKALQRIQNEEYGWCDSCGTAIGLRRLEALPTEELCLDCRELARQKEMRIG
ncbi:TraR/DksA C4-type zinc finger protein [Lentzea xinjiangensis]|nr:TraR/DksA C4-type zinc finger protein [Lentzea xinjiangensis]